jgi:hyperosmotically inducible periplasmic protein
MMASRLGKSLVIAFVCYATASALAQTSSSALSTPSASATTLDTGSAKGSTPSSKKADRELARRVRKALAKSGMVMLDVTVRARNGVVVLSGSVPTNAFVEQAETISSSVEGVISVDNRLSVRIDPRLLNGQSAGTGIPGKPIASARKTD